MPWAEVQSRLLALQRSGGLCGQPRPLTELDAHHRILRYTNYQVALANKGLLPARRAVPWGGRAAFLSCGLAPNSICSSPAGPSRSSAAARSCPTPTSAATGGPPWPRAGGARCCCWRP